MIGRVPLAVFLFAAITFALPGNLGLTQDNGPGLLPKPKGPGLQRSSDSPNPAAIDTIVGIRKQMGGGVAEILAKSEPRVQGSDGSSTLHVADNVFLEVLEQEFARENNANIPANADPASRADAVDLLRAASRQLDSAAADLEEAEKYLQADQYRSNAHKLRLISRRLSADPVPATIRRAWSGLFDPQKRPSMWKYRE